jgi:hypothetical protein
MNPLFDMLANMQTGAKQNDITAQMAKQFGLQQQQAQSAIEALMPAFTQGLKRNAAASPEGLASFMQALASGNHAQYMQDPMKAFSQNGLSEGNAILGHLFGNKEISRAVAKQAEATSGVSEAVLKQMLPALAPMVMGGLFKQMTGASAPAAAPQMQHAFGGSSGILGQILQEMMKGGLGQSTGQTRQQPQAKNPLEQILEQMTGRSSGGTQSSDNNSGGNLGDIFNEMLKNGPMGQTNPMHPSGDNQPVDPSPYDAPKQADETLNDIYGRRESAPEPEAEPKGYPKGTGLEDLFGDLFKPTKTGAPQYDKAIESIFDQFMKPRK